jgi:hypothetical protein
MYQFVPYGHAGQMVTVYLHKQEALALVLKMEKAGLQVWLKWYTACLASVRSWVQTLVPPKKKKWRKLLLYNTKWNTLGQKME